MAETIGTAELIVRANTQPLTNGLREAERQAEQQGRKIGEALEKGQQQGQQAARQRDSKGRFLPSGAQGAPGGFNPSSGQVFGPSGPLVPRSLQEIRERSAQGPIDLGKREVGIAGNVASALGGLGAGAAAGGFLKSSINAAVELETITRKLSNTLGPQGAGAALAFTRGTANELGLSFTALANSFGSFTAAATAANVPMETQKGLFSAVSKAGQALGLSNDEINGSLLALQQVASKGTVQMEELRGQLGERLPIAFNATAKGLGITQQELIKLVETGKLTAAEFFPALTKGLNELTAGSGGAPTAAQNFAKFGNAWAELQQKFGRNLLPQAVSAVETLTGAVEGLGVVAEAKELGLGGGLAGLLGFIPVEGAQAVGTLRQLQEQFGLTAAQSQKLFTDAAAEAGVAKDAFGQLNPSADQFGKILERLPELAKEFRAANPDTTGELNRANAAAAKANELAKEREKVAKAAAAAEREIVQPTRDRLELLQKMQGFGEEAKTRLQDEFALEKARRDEAEARLKLEEEIKRAGAKASTDEGVMRARKNLEAAGNNVGAAIIEASEKLKANAKDAAERLSLALRLRAAGPDGRLGVEQEIKIEEARKAVADAQRLLLDQQFKGDSEGINRASQNLNTAGDNLKAAIIEASETLKDAAKNAADSLKGAQRGFLSVGAQNFDLLTDDQRRSVRAGLESQIATGFGRTGLDPQRVAQRFGTTFTQNFGGSVDTSRLSVVQLEELAGIVNSLDDAQAALKKAVDSNTVAQAALNKTLTGEGLTVTAIVPDGVTVDAGALPVRYQ